MIIAVGFKVNNERAHPVQEVTNAIVKDFAIKGLVIVIQRICITKSWKWEISHSDS